MSLTTAGVRAANAMVKRYNEANKTAKRRLLLLVLVKTAVQAQGEIPCPFCLSPWTSKGVKMVAPVHKDLCPMPQLEQETRGFKV